MRQQTLALPRIGFLSIALAALAFPDHKGLTIRISHIQLLPTSSTRNTHRHLFPSSGAFSRCCNRSYPNNGSFNDCRLHQGNKARRQAELPLPVSGPVTRVSAGQQSIRAVNTLTLIYDLLTSTLQAVQGLGRSTYLNLSSSLADHALTLKPLCSPNSLNFHIRGCNESYYKAWGHVASSNIADERESVCA